MRQSDLKKYVGVDNRDLRLRNITEIDLLFYKHKIFIVAWQRAESVQAVAKTLNMSVRAVTIKASTLRKKGVELRFFRTPIGINKGLIERLKAIAGKSPIHIEKEIEKLVTLWPDMKNKDVAKNLGWTEARVIWTVSNLRKAGVPLAQKRRDYKKLIALAKEPPPQK